MKQHQALPLTAHFSLQGTALLIRNEIKLSVQLTWTILGSHLSTDTVFEGNGACLVAILLLSELAHDFDPARVLLEIVWPLTLNDIAEVTLLFGSKFTLLLVKLVVVESFVRGAVHVF